METKSQNEKIEHFIKVNDYFEIKVIIPKIMDLETFEAITLMAKKLININVIPTTISKSRRGPRGKYKTRGKYKDRRLTPEKVTFHKNKVIELYKEGLSPTEIVDSIKETNPEIQFDNNDVSKALFYWKKIGDC